MTDSNYDFLRVAVENLHDRIRRLEYEVGQRQEKVQYIHDKLRKDYVDVQLTLEELELLHEIVHYQSYEGDKGYTNLPEKIASGIKEFGEEPKAFSKNVHPVMRTGLSELMFLRAVLQTYNPSPANQLMHQSMIRDISKKIDEICK